MRVGLDTFSLYPLELGPFQAIDYVRQHGFTGLQFGGIRGLSKDLDPGKLREVRARADSLGLYSHVSVSSPNPGAVNRIPAELVLDLTAQIEVAASCGWHELHSALGGPKERYEHPVPWSQQLADSAGILRTLAPILRDHQSRINLETHGDTTTFELVRLCEDIGPDVLGICLDTANVLLFGEHPADAAARAAPYTHLTHTKDAILYFHDRGLERQGRPPGQGCIDWETLLPILAHHQPRLTLSIEDHKWLFTADIFDDAWLAQQPDLTRDELARTVRLAWQTHRRILSGDLPGAAAYEAIPYVAQMEERLAFGRDFLNALLARLRLND